MCQSQLVVTCMVTGTVTQLVTIGLHFARPIARSLAGLCLSGLRLSAAEIIDRAAQPRLRVRTAMSGPPYQAQKWSVASYNSAMCVSYSTVPYRYCIDTGTYVRNTCKCKSIRGLNFSYINVLVYCSTPVQLYVYQYCTSTVPVLYLCYMIPE